MLINISLISCIDRQDLHYVQWHTYIPSKLVFDHLLARTRFLTILLLRLNLCQLSKTNHPVVLVRSENIRSSLESD
jgi:hypothetical protein